MSPICTTRLGFKIREEYQSGPDFVYLVFVLLQPQIIIYSLIFCFQRVSRRLTEMMTWFPVCLFLALFASVRLEPASSRPGRYYTAGNGGANGSTSPKDGDNCDEASLGRIVCEDDRLRFCGPNNKIMSMPCTVSGRQGFCNCERTACVADKPVCSDETTSCIQKNTKLPDNLDCHKFSYCSSEGKKQILQCPGNLIYDPNTEKCTDQNIARCNRVVCPRPGNLLQLIPFPSARNYYVLCYQGLGDVRKCSDKYYAVRNNACQFDCKLKGQSGLFQDTNTERCKRGIYYACRRAGTNFTTVQAKCPTGMIFDEKLGLCTQTATCQEPGAAEEQRK